MPITIPLRFSPVYKNYIWGGTRIPQRFNRVHTPTPCAESWELASRPDGMSIVAEGPLTGSSLAELASQYATDLLGTRCTAQFPLLIKLIDARKPLSVQVHPNDQTAAAFGGEAKTEMWYVLEATPDAYVYAGLATRTTPQQLRAAIQSNTVADLLARIPVTAGQSVFIPGGTLHAIGEGCLLLEVQQNSNTTYRVYDWGRTAADGAPRELHVEQALQVIDWQRTRIDITAPILAPPGETNPIDQILTCDYFSIQRMHLSESHTISPDGTTFYALFTENGSATVTAGGQTITLPLGASCIIPAATDQATLTPILPDTRLIITTL